jgi:hypothetical protein
MTDTAVTITEHEPQEITVASKRRIVIILDLADSDANELANSIYEASGYLEQVSEGGWRSDPRVMFRLADALRAELGYPGFAVQAPSPGEFLAGQGDGEDDPPADGEDDPPADGEGGNEDHPAAPEGTPVAEGETPAAGKPAR